MKKNVEVILLTQRATCPVAAYYSGLLMLLLVDNSGCIFSAADLSQCYCRCKVVGLQRST